VIVNRANDFEKLGLDLDTKRFISKIKKKFPYKDFPEDKTKARNFYTATICNLVADSITDLFLQKQ